jgi:hypothetical protein
MGRRGSASARPADDITDAQCGNDQGQRGDDQQDGCFRSWVARESALLANNPRISSVLCEPVDASLRIVVEAALENPTFLRHRRESPAC